MYTLSTRTCVFLAVFVFIVLNAHAVSALQHKLTLHEDPRPRIRVESFGFGANGHLSLRVNNFMMESKNEKTDVDTANICWVLRFSLTGDEEFLDERVPVDCSATKDIKGSSIVRMGNWTSWTWEKTIAPGNEGFYTLYFVNQEANEKGFIRPVSMIGHLVQVNDGGNYLPVGQLALPRLYGFFTVVYTCMLVYWVWLLRSTQAEQTPTSRIRVHRIHWLMAVLVLLKAVSLLFHAIDFHYLNIVGHPGGWAVAYYTVNFLRGVMLFTIIALIGTGWEFIKPYLSDRDTKIFLVVIPLQILDNIALIVIEETTPGNRGWGTWEAIFRMVDIFCCGAILVPIVWSIKHLRDSAGADGKAVRNVEKLQMFRQYYLIVVSYIYFTRIIVYLFDATLPYQYSWLGDLITEASTVAFYAVTAYKFQPEPDNPYLKVDSDDEAEALRQLEEDDGGVLMKEDR